MARKQKYDEGTRNRLLQVATDLIFEKGFDGTAIRNITDEAGCKVGLFYYYFKSKKDMLSAMMENFFIPYEEAFSDAVAEAEKDPKNALRVFFNCMRDIVRQFRIEFAPGMHTGVRIAIREHSLSVVEKYLRQVIDNLSASGASLRMSEELTSVFLTHGVGSILLHRDNEWVDGAYQQVMNAVDALIGFEESENAPEREIIETERLKIVSLTAEDMREWISARDELCEEMGVVYDAEPTDEWLKSVLNSEADKCQGNALRQKWETFRWIVRKEDGTVVGSFDFKSPPDENGIVEIGYGLGENHRGQGYMTETVRALCVWAKENGASAVIAETERDNIPSENVLLRSDFVIEREEENRWWINEFELQKNRR